MELDVTTNSRDIARFLRVDHAGERAAQQIYRGQLAVLRDHSSGPEIQHMMEQEVEHLETFEDLLNERGVRPSMLDPLWGVAGYALGFCHRKNGSKGGDGLHDCCRRSDRRALCQAS